jgi:hypothetical protein
MEGLRDLFGCLLYACIGLAVVAVLLCGVTVYLAWRLHHG